MSLFDKKHLTPPADTLPGRNTPMPAATLHVVNGHSTTSVPDGMEITIFMIGYFRNVERLFWQLPGVYSTAAAYIGGYTPNPTYREVYSGYTGHAEAVCIVYDLSVISYEQLLRVFWENHDPAQRIRQDNDHGTQCRSAIYPLTLEQDAAAHTSLERFQTVILATDDGHHITAEIASATPFYYAENDHQQCLHKNPYGYRGIGGIGACLPSETQRYGYKCRLLIRCTLFMPDTAQTPCQTYKIVQIQYIVRTAQACPAQRARQSSILQLSEF